MKFHKKILKNGLRLITVPMKGNETVTVMVLVGAGSFNESKQDNGIAHFLEHMCFKGTARRPSAYQVSFDFEKIGASYNAFTSNEYTGYYAKAHCRHLSEILELVSDMYLHPLLPADEMEKEKGVIIEEINRSNDVPARVLWQEVDKVMYGDQPAGRNILGPKENIKRFKVKDILEYREKYYAASNTTVIVAGKYPEAMIVRDIEKRFSELSKNKDPTRIAIKESQKDIAVANVFKKTDQSTLALVFRAFDRYDERSWALGLASTILGRGMSSRLFQKMRQELGICYSIHTHVSTASDHGSFIVSSGVSHTRVIEAVSGILLELKKIKENLVSDSELQKAKDQSIGAMYLGLESSDDFADFYGFQEIFKEKIYTPAEMESKIRAVTAKDVYNVAHQIFVPKHLTVGCIGPHKKEMEKLIKKAVALIKL